MPHRGLGQLESWVGVTQGEVEALGRGQGRQHVKDGESKLRHFGT